MSARVGSYSRTIGAHPGEHVAMVRWQLGQQGWTATTHEGRLVSVEPTHAIVDIDGELRRFDLDAWTLSIPPTLGEAIQIAASAR